MLFFTQPLLSFGEFKQKFTFLVRQRKTDNWTEWPHPGGKTDYGKQKKICGKDKARIQLIYYYLASA